jgi:hypothetical protein
MARANINIAEAAGSRRDQMMDTLHVYSTTDGTNDMQFRIQNGDIVHVSNENGAGALQVDVTAVTDRDGRAIGVSHSLAVGSEMFIGPLRNEGWAQKGAGNEGQCFVNLDRNDGRVVIIRPKTQS